MSDANCKAVRRSTMVLALLAAGMCSFPDCAFGGTDVYVLFSRDSKADKDRVVSALSKNHSVKAYMADLLLVADYSAKQKIVAKVGSARLVVVVAGSASKALKGSTIRAPVLVTNSVEKTVTSNAWIVNVVDKGSALGKIGGDARSLEVAGEGDLGNLETIRASDVVVVDETTIQVSKVIAAIADMVLKRS